MTTTEICPCGMAPRLAPDAYCAACADEQDADRADLEQPRRVVDRTRQWRKVDAGHYTSPKGRFHAARDDDGGWTLIDTTGEHQPEFFDRWRDARRHVEAIEFGATDAPVPITIEEDEIHDEYRHVIRLCLVRGDQRLGDVVIRDGEIEMPRFEGPVAVDEAEAFATALMLATHHAAAMDRDAS